VEPKAKYARASGPVALDGWTPNVAFSLEAAGDPLAAGLGLGEFAASAWTNGRPKVEAKRANAAAIRSIDDRDTGIPHAVKETKG
jgi:hypothetical protein